jgi:hypothetical protein
MGDGSAPQPADDYSLSWTASEYVSHHKGSGWYLMLVVVAVAISAVIYLMTKDIFSVIVVIVMAVLVGVYGAREPRSRTYAIGEHGLLIGDHYYPYESFKSYSLLREDAIGFVSLAPSKRFMPPMAMYYAPEDEEQIVTALGNYIPYEERKHDLVDRLSQKARF